MTARLDAALAELAAAIREELAESQPVTAGAPDRLYSVEEAAELLGVGRTLAYAEIQAGRLRSHKVGRRRLVAASAITAYAAGNRA